MVATCRWSTVSDAASVKSVYRLTTSVFNKHERLRYAAALNRNVSARISVVIMITGKLA
tara:strand:+ start:216 stop:392 length:177 start_codon:yes stop_codon:yes gene_type:complete